jgi:hypothetical protein
MIVLHGPTRTVGRMIRSSRSEIEYSIADTRELLRFGRWRFSGETVVHPRHELQQFISRDSALNALRKIGSQL